MQTIHSKKLDNVNYDTPVNEVSMLVDKEERRELAYTPWSEYPYKPGVNFSIAHSETCIFLKYNVEEKFIRAANGKTNSAVYEDSCVEFFIAFNNRKEYYNIEFNCVGACTIGYGSEKANRVLLPCDIIEKIKFEVFIRNSLKKNIVQWQITLIIPSNLFIHDNIGSLSGKECAVNFYKCGDLLPEPHFVSWSDIESEEPNFHLSDFFGKLLFE